MERRNTFENKGSLEKIELSEKIELERMGITEEKIKRIKASPRFLKAFKMLLVGAGLFLFSPREALAQKFDGNQDKQPVPEVDGGVESKEETEVLKNRFINLVIKLQELGLLKYNDGPSRGIEPTTFGQIGQYEVSCVFHHFPRGSEEGKITGKSNEWITISSTDSLGVETTIENRFERFSAYAISNVETLGLKAYDRSFFFDKGIILGGRDKDRIAFYADLKNKEIKTVIDNLESLISQTQK